MSTQQDIHADGSESRPPMLNKENYVPWSSRLLRYAKSRPNGKLIHNSIINVPYVRRMIPEPAVDSCETAQEIWLRVQQMMKGSDIEIQENKANQNGVGMLLSFIRLRICTQLITLNSPHQDQPSFNQNYIQQPMPNPEDITDPTTAMNMALSLIAKAFKLNYSTPTNNNQMISSNPRNRQIAQPHINMGQDRQMQMVGGNGENQFRQYAGQNVRNLNGYSAVQNVRNQVAQNPRVQNVRNQNGLIGVLGNANLNGNSNLVVVHAEGNAAGHNGNPLRCYNCRGIAHFSRNCTAGIQLQAEEFDLMADAVDLDEIEEVNAKYILMANLQQASTSGTQTDKAPVYDSDGSAEVHDYENYDDNEIFNMFTQEEQYTELLEPIPEPHQVPHNDHNVISESSRSKNKGAKVDEHHRNLLLSKNTKHMSSTCNNIKLDSDNVISKVVCAMCKQCLISINHDVCLRKYVNGKNSDGKKQKANVSIKEKQKKHQPKVKKPKKHKALELEIKRLLRAVVSQDIMSVVQKEYVVDTSNLQTELECMKERFENCIIKKENEYAKLLNDWEAKHVPNIVRASARTKPITVLQPLVITKKDVNSDSNGLSFTGIDNTKTRRPQPRSNTKNDRKFMGTVRFRNDHVAAILGFVDLQWGNILITRVYFVKGLGHNLFSVGQFCDSDLEVAFRRNVCFVKNLEGVDLLKRDHLTNLYTVNLHEMASASPICLMARASSTKSWLWHQRLSHLNFDTIYDLAKNDLVSGLPKFKYHKEHLCPLCEQGKSKRASHPPKPVPNSRQRLHLLHMDLYGPMRIASINGKRYVLVIVDDYSYYTWVHFLRSKDETPEVIKTFLKRITVHLQSPVIIIRTDNGIEFKNQVLKEYFDSVGISHQMSSVRTPQQNKVVERINRTLIEAARTMLIFSRAPLFLWAEAIATVCFTQNRSIIHRRFNKTPYELINGRKPDSSFLHVFEALCYPKNDRDDIGKLGAKCDIGFFIGYSTDSCAYCWVY
nr:retrovirus-related Pol polyprotein from transposon TNT 1-94 [Tanacetum cinerariifolium]